MAYTGAEANSLHAGSVLAKVIYQNLEVQTFVVQSLVGKEQF